MSIALSGSALFHGSAWTFADLDRTYDAIAEVAHSDLGLDTYRNQIEIISSEQMLDAHSSIGMPLMYGHWSFGKRFAIEANLYRRGLRGLAYEIVINSNPCVSYHMEQNTMPMHAMVMAHAAFGHNHFFKNNEQFQQWTDPEGILDYLQFAKQYVSRCEREHGIAAVEDILDAAHALMDQGVFRYRRQPRMSDAKQRQRLRERRSYEEQTFDDMWRTLPAHAAEASAEPGEAALSERRQALLLPEENLLYFLEKNSPILKPWQREILRIVRTIAQYFYPQRQTKVMNEGCACFVHHYIMSDLSDRGLIDDGAMLEILHHHASVVFQPAFEDPRYGGLNPYALGYGMMRDIRRMCEAPTEEDLAWFPQIAGCGDWRGVLKDAWANYRDESFIQQYLSPRLIRDMRLFVLRDQSSDPFLTVRDIHDPRGYRGIRDALSRAYDVALNDPDIQVVDVDLKGDRRLLLQYTMRNGVPLLEDDRDEVLRHVRRLWGYEVALSTVDAGTGHALGMTG